MVKTKYSFLSRAFLIMGFMLLFMWSGVAGAAQWAETYGGTNFDTAYSTQQTQDGGYIVAGYTNSFGAGSGDAWGVKLNPDGSVAWQKTYGGTNYDDAYSTQQTQDGGYIMAGITYSFGEGSSDAWVIKLNPDGSVAWQKTYGGTNYDVAYSIQQTQDGGYIVAGDSWSFGAGNTDAWVVKLNPDGSVAWQKTYGGTNYDNAYSIQQTQDGGYIVAGQTQSFGAGFSDAWIIKLNQDGSVAWQNTYGGTKYDLAQSIQQTQDGGYILAGLSDSFGGVFYDHAWVVKLNPDGSVAWQNTYGGTSYDVVYSIQQTQDGGYILAGETWSFSVAASDAWVIKLNPDGSLAWQKTYGGAKYEAANSIRQAQDGGYIVAGYTDSFGTGSGDAWVLRLDGAGEITACAAMGSSTATVTNTSVTGGGTTATITNSIAAENITSISEVNSSLAKAEVCYYLPPVSVSLSPDSATVPRGGTLGYWVTAINNTSTNQCFDYWTNVTLPNSSKYPQTGELFGPYNLCLDAHASKQAHLTQGIPVMAPLGTYTYNGFVGPYPAVWAEGHFNFTVLLP